MSEESYEHVSPELSYSTDKKGHSVFLHLRADVTSRLAKEEEVPLGTGS